jgi:hypothetical protein
MTKETLTDLIEKIVFKHISYTREPLEDGALDEELDEYFENCFEIDVDSEGIVDDLIKFNIIKESEEKSASINGIWF